MLIRKIQRQPAADTSSPPAARPRVPATADRPPQNANARFRAGPAGYTLDSIARVVGTTKAADSPSAARVAIITATFGASAEASEETVNIAVPPTSSRRRPSRSPARPASSMKPPNGTM
jgi:hypothetical protein